MEESLRKPIAMPQKLTKMLSVEQDRKEDGDETNLLSEFKFTKHFSELDYSRIFTPIERLLHLEEKDTFKLNKNMKSRLVDAKSDEIYYNESFQAQKYIKYCNLLKSILHQSEDRGKLTQETVE